MQVFHVLTEFQFEIGSALLHSEQLQGAVTQISTAADNALGSLQKLGLGVAASFGLAELSAVSLLGKAVQVSDKYALTQNAFANLIAANKDKLQGPIATFNDQLAVSETIMGKISKIAREFSLDETAMLDMSKLLTGQLAPKGLAGDNFGTAIDISRSLLKSAPTLGLDIGEIQGQLMRTIEGKASIGDVLFRRLVQDAPKAFTGLKGKDITHGFNALPAAQRVKVLQDALGQFSNNAAVVTANVNSLNGQMRLLYTLIAGPISSILRPLGDALRGPIINALKQLNAFIDKQGRIIVSSLASIVKNLLKSPEKLIVDLMQLSKLSHDLKLGGEILSLNGTLLGFAASIGMLKKHFPNVVWIQNLGRGMKWLSEWLATAGKRIGDWAGQLGRFLFSARGISFVFDLLWFSISKILAPAALLTTILQGVSRGFAQAKVNSMKNFMRILPEIAPSIAKMSAGFMNMLYPFRLIVDGIASIIAWIFEFDATAGDIKAFQVLSDFFKQLGFAVVEAFGGMYAAVDGFFGLIDNLMHGKFNTDGVAEHMADSFHEFMKKNLAKVDEGKNTSNHVTNYNMSGDITIRNDFKEQQEPDRVAFSIKEQLIKAGTNRTQGRNRALSAPLVAGGH